METLPITCLVPAADSLGEGCAWEKKAKAIWWLDIARPSRIHRYVPATGAHRTWYSTLLLTTLALRSTGGLILGGENGVYAFDPLSGAITAYAAPENDRPQNRFNDGACDPNGRLWIGTMQQNIGPDGEELPITQDSGALYSVLSNGTSVRVEDNIGVSNGPCWSPDHKTFYFSDSRKQVIYAYDFNKAEGTISNRRVLNDTKAHGYPDGATVDAEGCIWSARWDGACVLRITPRGKIDRIIAMPAQRPTCLCFGGTKLDTLYVTTSRAHLPPQSIAQYPLQGGLFCFNPGAKGTVKFTFKG